MCIEPIASMSYSSEIDQRAAKVIGQRCLSCHDANKKEAGLDLSQASAALQGGESGPGLIVGDVAASLLWKRIAADEMPPENPLSDVEKELLKSWIASGAKWPAAGIDPFAFTSESRAGYDWWALQSLAQSELRYVPGSSVHPIDEFVDSRLAQAGLKRSPAADRRSLIRRLYVDLHGLLPTPVEIDALLTDSRPDAITRLIDELLSSEEYGQRWARHWLDIARFGESQGFERDKLRTNSWRYRDWVVNAFNHDMPYDEFARMQLAGDVLQPGDAQALIATGFLVAAPYDEVGKKQQSLAMRAVVRQDELEDLVSAVAQTFLGLTANCARCHDHKFDPILQREYYQLTAALAGVEHGEPSTTGLSGVEELNSLLSTYDTRTMELQQRIETIDAEVRKRILEKRPRVDISESEIQASLDDETRMLRGQISFELEQLAEHRRRASDATVYAVAAVKPQETFILLRGNPATPGPPVAAGGIASIQGVVSDFNLPLDASDADRRRRLAQWITDQNNPLFARVIVNRLWHYHFGVGLVDTPNDFGFNGGRPSHPELLDWLAAELIRGDWSLKHIQRCILSSATYQQSSQFAAEAAQVDQNNRLLWRMSPKRLDAETLRDTLLQFAGKLERRSGGPGFYEFTTYVHNSQFYDQRDAIGSTFERRTLYRTWVRSARSNFLDAFDCPDPSTKAPQRAATTTPLQALSLLNNAFVLRMADSLAERAQQAHHGPTASGQTREQIAYVLREVFGRSASDLELSEYVEFVNRTNLAAFCRAVFNSNELLYID